MANIANLKIDQRVTALVDGQQREGRVVGRRVNNRIEGYMAPPDNIHPFPERSQDMVQVSFPMRWTTFEWVTTGLTCAPDRLELIGSGS